MRILNTLLYHGLGSVRPDHFNEHPILFALIIAIAIGFFVYAFAQFFIDVRKERKGNADPIKAYKVPIEIDRVLADKIDYYRRLPKELKDEFALRTLRFAKKYRWISGDRTPITEEMQILVSAAIVQLLFGLPKLTLGQFQTIVIFRDKYLNGITNKYHKGEVNQRYIVLSYNHFIEGYLNPTDKLNVGLHEMAHALDLSTFLSYGKRYFMRSLMENFMNKTHQEYADLHNGEIGFLREYGGQNLREFFAVAVEHFFEAPAEMEQKMPNLYRELCLVLNQDPAENVFRGVSSKRLENRSNFLETDISDYQPITLQTTFNKSLFWPPFGSVALLVLLGAIAWAGNEVPPVAIIVFFGTAILLSAFIDAKKRTTRINANDSYLLVKSPFKRSNYAISLPNIVLVAVEKNLNYYLFHVSFFDKGQVKEIDFRAYIAPDSFAQLCNFLANKQITLDLDGKIVGKRTAH